MAYMWKLYHVGWIDGLSYLMHRLMKEKASRMGMPSTICVGDTVNPLYSAPRYNAISGITRWVVAPDIFAARDGKYH